MSFEYLKKTPRPPGAEKGMDLAGKALTPKSERRRSTYGSLEMSVQTIPGLCEIGRKCIRRNQPEGECWP